jgi:hypothetical protein
LIFVRKRIDPDFDLLKNRKQFLARVFPEENFIENNLIRFFNFLKEKHLLSKLLLLVIDREKLSSSPTDKSYLWLYSISHFMLLAMFSSVVSYLAAVNNGM